MGNPVLPVLADYARTILQNSIADPLARGSGLLSMIVSRWAGKEDPAGYGKAAEEEARNLYGYRPKYPETVDALGLMEKTAIGQLSKMPELIQQRTEQINPELGYGGRQIAELAPYFMGIINPFKRKPKINMPEKPLLPIGESKAIIDYMPSKKGPGTPTETSPVVKPEGGNPTFTRSEQLKPYSYDMEINPGGNVHVVGDMVSKQRIRDGVSSFFREKQKELYGEPDTFWRFTNNPDEINLVKSGQIRNSIDHSSGNIEKGVSVSEHLGYSIAGYKHGYKVKGKVVGYGFDGEPLLDPSTIEVVGKMLHNDGIRLARKKDITNFKKTLSKYGWTEEQYSKISDGNFDLPNPSRSPGVGEQTLASFTNKNKIQPNRGNY